MAANWSYAVLSSEIKDNNTDNDGDQTTKCARVQYIPGIASNETVQGLFEFHEKYSRIHGHIAVAVCLFGILANFANIIVLTRKNMASSTNTILLWLAVADLLTMLDYLPFAIHFYIMKPSDVKRAPFSTTEFSWICFLLFHASFSIVCHTVAIWLTIALAIFRYIYICKPTRGAYYCSQQRACFVVVAIIILTIILCIPNYAVNTFDYSPGTDIQRNVNNYTGSTHVAGGDSYYYPTIIKSVDRTTELVNGWVQAVIIKLVPCFMLVTLTILLVHAMHKAYRKRLKLKSQGRRAESDKHGEHNRATGMLLAIVVLFTLTELPQGILTLMNIFAKCFLEAVYNNLGDLLDIMALINNSVNFVLYCIMSTQFRTTFASIFCLHRSSRPDWLKMGFIKSQHGNKNSIEVIEDGKTRALASKNGRASKAVEPGKLSPERDEIGFNCRLVHPGYLGDSPESPGSRKNNEKTLLVSSNGTSTLIHGYSPGHSHL